MADTVIENIQHDGKDIKLPQSMIDGLTAALANLLLQKVDSINFDSSTSKLTLTFGTGDPLSTDIVLGDLSQLNKNGNANTYLNGSGQWSTPPDTNTIYNNATSSADGLMSKSDKSKLDGIATGAQVNSITGVKGNSESTYRTGNINITAANIGLGNVANTADADKTVKSAGTCTGNSATATKLQTARTIQTNLASANSASFDGSGNVSPGVTGILPVANGGTGNASGTAKYISSNLIESVNLNEISNSGICYVGSSSSNLPETDDKVVNALVLTFYGTASTGGNPIKIQIARVVKRAITPPNTPIYIRSYWSSWTAWQALY
ncbi:MAG: hypothetical protein IJ728_12810 [Selenomonadaceae bacterium]|nr:hypothetical protein [Selenomonadaceae bacterium]